MRAEDTQRVATQGNLQGVTPSVSPFAAPMPTAIPRPAPRLLTPLPSLDWADVRGQHRRPAVFRLYSSEMSEPTMGPDTPTTCKTEQGVWGTPDSSCDATITTEDTQDTWTSWRFPTHQSTSASGLGPLRRGCPKVSPRCFSTGPARKPARDEWARYQATEALCAGRKPLQHHRGHPLNTCSLSNGGQALVNGSGEAIAGTCKTPAIPN
eukprot:3047116-Alexandrium_andersonii.AAC.1